MRSSPQFLLQKIAIATGTKHKKSISIAKKTGDREKYGLSFTNNVEMYKQQIFRASNPRIAWIERLF